MVNLDDDLTNSKVLLFEMVVFFDLMHGYDCMRACTVCPDASRYFVTATTKNCPFFDEDFAIFCANILTRDVSQRSCQDISSRVIAKISCGEV